MQPVIRKGIQADSSGIGLDIVEAKDEPAVRLPDLIRLPPAEQPEFSKFEALFPLRSIDDYIFERIFPSLLGSDIFIPAIFRRCLAQTRAELRKHAGTIPGSAKNFGKIASLLDDEKSLLELLQLYRSALLQG